MMSESSELLSVTVPCNHQAPAAVRHALGQIDRLSRFLDDGLLVASELVTNAVLHSGCAVGHEIEVSANLSDDRLLISVHDPGLSGREATHQASGHGRGGGWGLEIVDRLAVRWGAERPDGYRVWAELSPSS
jgi:anti-sigma regulatory factor (Ser/Thr protein kinase)